VQVSSARAPNIAGHHHRVLQHKQIHAREYNMPLYNPRAMNILVIVAHPDDPEFFAGGSIARWTSEGHRVRYVIVTDGSKGNDDPAISASQLISLRQTEQRNAAAVLGVSEIVFMRYVDGELANTLELQRDLAREVRDFKADMIVTTDPQTLHYFNSRVNHNDHRVIGMAVCDAIFPASGNRMYFAELLENGAAPHSPRELLFTGALIPNHLVDISATIDRKIESVKQHVSQVKQPDQIGQRMRNGAFRMFADGSAHYFENFRRVMM
jgi:LmbE family N-acetylglucosaminyl deacetylase